MGDGATAVVNLNGEERKKLNDSLNKIGFKMTW